MFNVFKGYYQTYFGSFPAKERYEIELWNRLISQLKTRKMVEDLFEYAEKVRAKDRPRPLLKEMEKYHKDLSRDDTFAIFSESKCTLCSNGQLDFRANSNRTGIKYFYVIPCICSAGQYWARASKIDFDQKWQDYAVKEKVKENARLEKLGEKFEGWTVSQFFEYLGMKLFPDDYKSKKNRGFTKLIENKEESKEEIPW